MSEFNGRRAPNFSQYLDDLNAIPSPYDQAVQQQQKQDSFNLDAELSLFTNAEFFDFDQFNLPTFDSVDNDKLKDNSNNVEQNPDLKFLDFLNDGLNNMSNDFSSTNFNSVGTNNSAGQSVSTQNAPFTNVPSVSNGLPNVNTAEFSNQSSPISPSQPSAPAQESTPAPTPKLSASTATKRKPSHKPTPMSIEEASRNVAEEDKRRRNTAASARFRVKKKMREQTLEKTVKDTTEKNAALEARVTALELENQWLKNLITEKNGRTPDEGKTSQNDIASMFKKFLAAQKNLSESREVGTTSS
ncbi:putative bZIP transcription factor (MetR) [Aspergillus ruber CBS 135680]|uniref:BZIP domain-containing protein n=1 Tax=Aspergillus ruber (strain CBS 135680) TaxID=1388766 RepID=A0A017SLM7_ASPRC|nr:uncharacterized protein EURHEDRAFT_472160 [Aspergillus ruber CBS 135680]EYE97857.1 hypothetical protein EURHEDRAFT_472160 [Aspergillus ruber CBS 135680]